VAIDEMPVMCVDMPLFLVSASHTAMRFRHWLSGRHGMAFATWMAGRRDNGGKDLKQLDYFAQIAELDSFTHAPSRCAEQASARLRELRLASWN